MITESEFKKAWEVMKTWKTVLIVTHASPDPDAAASTGAMAEILKLQALVTTILVQKEDQATHLEFDNSVRVFDGEVPEADGVLLLDAEAPFRAGKELSDVLEKADSDCIVIDHHENQSNFGKLKLSDFEATSTAEIIFQLAQNCNLELSQIALDKLYTGLMGDTGFLQFPGTTIRSFESAAALRKLGANHHYAYEKILHNGTVNKIHLFGEFMKRTTVSKTQPQLAFTYATITEVNEFPKEVAELKTPLGWEMLQIRGVELAFFLRESNDGRYKISLRGTGHYSCADFSKLLGGGGHENAAGASATGNLDQVIDTIEKAFSQLIRDKI